MKGNIIVMAIIAASSFLTISCNKEIPEPDNRENVKTFTATIEQDITKTTLSEGTKVFWESGDCININGSGYAATPLDPATKATFADRWWGDEPTSPYHAIFPASLHNGSGFEFPASQEYAAGKFNAPMYAEGDTEILAFKNICGVLCFSLTGTDKVKRISVTANEAVCGTFTVVSGTTVNLTGTGKTVTLYCGQQGVQLSQTPTNFYIYLPPQQYSSGMKITITNTEEDVFEKVTKVTADIARSTVYTFDWNVTFSPVLTGQFSVSASDKVTFSQGNFHATKVGENWLLGFYERQNEVNPIATVTNATVIGARTASKDDKEIDLFTWGYGSNFTNDPTTLSFAGQSFADWGQLIGSGSTWRTLSSDEWEYLLDRVGPNSNALSRSDVEVCGVKGCLVIAPDVFTGEIADYYDEASWATAEKTDGLVCLPSSGHRFGVGVGNTGRLGFYWTSTANDASNAYSLSLSKLGQSTRTQLYSADPSSSPTGSYSDPGDQVTITVKNEDFSYYEISSTSIDEIWNSWKRQVQFYGVDYLSQIKIGSNCILKVRAKTESGSLDILPFLQGDKGADKYQGCNFPSLSLSEEWQYFEVQLTNNLDKVENLCFNVGNTEGKKVYLAEISLDLSKSEQLEVRGAQGFPSPDGKAFGPETTFHHGENTVDGIRCYQMDNTSADVAYSVKYQIEFPEGTFEQGKKCRLRIKAKASSNKTIQCYLLKSFEGQYPNCGYFPSIELTTNWQEFVIETNCTDSDATAIAFDFGDFEGSIYLADFSAYNLVEIPFAAATTDGVGTAANDKKFGLSVRLVRDFNPAANLNSLSDNNDYGTLFK